MAVILHTISDLKPRSKIRAQVGLQSAMLPPSSIQHHRNFQVNVFTFKALFPYYEQTGSNQGQGIYGYMHASYMGICMQTSWPCKQSGATRIHVHAYTLHIRPRLLLTRGDARQPLAPMDYGIRSTRGKAGKDVRQHYHEADASKQEECTGPCKIFNQGKIRTSVHA